MENVADALKIAFGIFVFIVALSILFVNVSQLKDLSDLFFFHLDRTNFYDHTVSRTENRNVSYSDVVSTLYRYNIESLAVRIRLRNGADFDEYYFDKGNETVKKVGEEAEVKTELNTAEKIERYLGEFVNDILGALPEGTTFTEQFIEVPISGIYITANDGSEVVLSNGGKKIYLTYTQNP